MMKAEYRDDRQKGPGHGELVLSGALMPEAPWQIAIQRGSDHNYLSGKSGGQWLGERVYINIAGRPEADGSLCLELGPEIVDSLNQMDQYQLYLKNGGEEPLKARLRVREISYSPSGNLDNTARLSAVPENPEPAPEPPAPKPAPQTVAEQALEDSLELTPPPPPRPNRKLWRYCLLALLALLCIAWFVIDMGRDKQGESPLSLQEPKKQDESRSPQAGASPAQQAAPVPPTAEQQVSGFFAAANATPQAAYELSRQLPAKTAADQDAIYRLYYYAAENDLPAALMSYAGCLDPSKPRWGTIEKDAPLAWTLYERAKSVEPAQAEAAQKHLLAWLREQAASGNAGAGEWLKAVEK